MTDHDTSCWQYKSNIIEEDNERYANFQEFMKTASETVEMLLNKIPKVSEITTISKNIENDIDFIREKNKELKQEIEHYASEAKTTQTECQNLKTDKEVVSQSLKDTHRALLLAKSFFKKELDIYYTIESFTYMGCVVYLQFFTQKRTENSEYFVRLARNTKIQTNELLEMSPRLPTFQQLRKRLCETNDVPGFLCCVRQSFLAIKQKKEGTTSGEKK